jgi:hypothetical protein
MSVGVEMSADLEGLLAALTWDNWFEMLPVIHDAYREQSDDAGDAVAWLIERKRRPLKLANEPHNKGHIGRFIWPRDSDFSTQSVSNVCETCIPYSFANQVDRFHSKKAITYAAIPAEKGIADLLKAVVAAWMVGHRPVYR